MSLDVRKNDTVMVISGEDKGKKGRLLAVYPVKDKLIVEKLNMIKRHMKPSKKYSQGGIIEKEAPVHRSNVMLVCSKCNKPTKIEHKILEDRTKVRICKKCTEILD